MARIEAPEELNDADLKRLLGLILGFKRKSSQQRASENPEYILSSILQYLTEPGRVILIAREDGLIVGFLAAHTTQMVFSPELVAQESGWFVADEYRKSGIGGALLSAYVEWANGQGVSAKYIYPTSGMAPKNIERYLEIHGFENMGIVARQR